MVCKEELCCWFKNLNPRNRIEYMCALLHMCLPLELRFVGTVLEHYGKKDYHYLRNDEVAANKQSEITKYRNITKPEVLRAKVFVTLALMRSSSTACAQIIFDIIESKLDTVFSFTRGADSQVADEILTVLTLAANHPAFMFEQKLRLHDHLQALQHELESQREKVEEEVSLDLYPGNHPSFYSAEDPALYNNLSPVQTPRKAVVQLIEVRGPKKGSEMKSGPEYQIVATWSSGDTTEVSKRFRDIQDFDRQMGKKFPAEKPPNGRLPALPAGSSHQHSSREEHIAEQIQMLNTYFRSLTSVPSDILENELVCQFFKGQVIRQAPPLSVAAPPHPYQPDEEEMMNAAPMQMKSMGLRNSHLYYLTPQLNDAAGRLPRIYAAPYYGRFLTSPPIQLLVASPHVPLHQQPQPQPALSQQQPSPVSPARSELSSTTTSPTGSRSTSPDPSTPSVNQLLKLLGLDKYSSALAGLTVEQLASEDLTKRGLTHEAQHSLRTKLDQITSEKHPMNGYPPSNLQWMSTYPHFRAPLQPASPRLGVMDSTLGPMSDIMASGGGASPPISPGPAKIQRALLGKGATAEDSSEGSEDLDREKGESVAEGVKPLSQPGGKTAQVKVSPGSGGGAGGGCSSPRPPSANSRMTPPDDPGLKQPLLPPHILPYPCYYHPAHPSNPAPSGMVDPKGEVGMLGVVPNSNTNNNFTTEPIPIVSTGLPQRPGLIPTGGAGGGGGGGMRPTFKTGQPPQPAHTNLGMLPCKNLINMPAEPKPGSPVIPWVGMRPTGDMQQPPLGGANSQLEGGPQRMPLYLYGSMGQPGAMVSAAALPPVHPAQPGLFSNPLATRSVQTSLPGSSSVMTVSACHPVTVVTTSHSTASSATGVHRSPSHGNGNGSNGQRDSGNESLSGGGSGLVSDSSLRSSPLQGVAVTVSQGGSASSPPASQSCQTCAHGVQIPHNQYGLVHYPCPPFYIPPAHTAHNGMIPMPAMSSFYNPPLASGGVLTNGFTSDLYPFSHAAAAYPALNPSTAHMYPVMQGGSMYPGTPSQVAVGQGGNRSSMPPPPPPPQPLPTAGGGVGTLAGQQLSSVAVKQRNTGCYNCGSLTHKAADCNESSMETMSGKSVYSLDYKRSEESD